MAAISATAEKSEEKESIDTRPTVSTMLAEAGNYQVTITSFGEVAPVESTLLSAQVSGEVVSWNPKFTAGGIIQRGEKLFTIEKDSYEAALLQAEANLSRAEANLIEEQAKAKVAEDEARRIGKKVSDLYLRKPQLISAKANVKSAQASLKIAKRDLANCEVTAPYDTLIISRKIGVGQFVNKGATIAELNNIESAKITFPIPGFDQQVIPEHVEGVEAEISLHSNHKIHRAGTIQRDLGIVDNATRMSHLVAEMKDPYGLNSANPTLKFGTYVEVRFRGKVLKNVYKLPQNLVTNNRVWLVNENNQLEPREVKVVREEGEFFLIRSGLSEKDMIVTTIPDYPQKGMEVKRAGADAQIAALTQQ